MEKLYTSKTFLKMADGRMHIPHPTPLDPPVAISYRNHQKSRAYLAWHKAPLPPLNTTLNTPKYAKYDAVKSKKDILVLRCPVTKYKVFGLICDRSLYFCKRRRAA